MVSIFQSSVLDEFVSLLMNTSAKDFPSTSVESYSVRAAVGCVLVLSDERLPRERDRCAPKIRS